MNKRTKIVCTIGPASEKKSTLEKMVSAGMNVARLNFSHGTYKNHRLLINNIRSVGKKLGQPVAILQDLQGPRIRTGEVSKQGIELVSGKDVVLFWENRSSKELVESGVTAVPVQYDLSKVVRKKTRILINDGLFELRVDRFSPAKSFVYCRVIRGGVVTSHRGINIPKTKIEVPTITYRDKEDLKFGLKEGIDWVALSFVREAADVVQLRKLIKKYQPNSQVKIIAKIERQEAVNNFDAILEVVDGIMVARGDLGIELPPAEIPLIQKRIVTKCLETNKPVIVATQMMESMMEHPRPTRAEVSDVANAVADHTDAVMLSGETATGKYPVEVVKMMAKTVSTMEGSPYDNLAMPPKNSLKDVKLSLAYSAAHLIKQLKAKAVIVLTTDGKNVERIVRFRPETKILALTSNKKLQQQLALVWGVEARIVTKLGDMDGLIKQAKKIVLNENIAKKKNNIVVVSGEMLRVVEV